MNAKKMRRCKRALERLVRNIDAYTHGRPINAFQASVQTADAETWKWACKDRLTKAVACRDALISKGVYVDKGK